MNRHHRLFLELDVCAEDLRIYQDRLSVKGSAGGERDMFVPWLAISCTTLRMIGFQVFTTQNVDPCVFMLPV